MARKPRKWALGLVALAPLGVVGTLAEVGPVELDLTSRAAMALGGAGLEGPALLVNGRDVAISGEASSASARQGAFDAVAGVPGVRRVDAELVWIKLGAGGEPGAAAPRAGLGVGVDFLGYDFSFLWPWLAPAAILGAAVARPRAGGAGASSRLGYALALWLGAAAIAFGAGVLVAATRWPPGRQAFWLEAGSLFLTSYCVGAAARRSFCRWRAPGGRLVR